MEDVGVHVLQRITFNSDKEYHFKHIDIHAQRTLPGETWDDDGKICFCQSCCTFFFNGLKMACKDAHYTTIQQCLQKVDCHWMYKRKSINLLSNKKIKSTFCPFFLSWG